MSPELKKSTPTTLVYKVNLFDDNISCTKNLFLDSHADLAQFGVLDQSIKVGVDEADDLLGFILLKVSHNELDIVQLGLTIHDDHIRCNTDLVILVNVFKEWHQERDDLGETERESVSAST